MGSTCRNLNDGYECIANATFNGVNSSLSYSLGSLESSSSESPISTSYNSIDINYRYVSLQMDYSIITVCVCVIKLVQWHFLKVFAFIN